MFFSAVSKAERCMMTNSDLNNWLIRLGQIHAVKDADGGIGSKINFYDTLTWLYYMSPYIHNTTAYCEDKAGCWSGYFYGFI